MENKLKHVLDNLDVAETEKLLKPEYDLTTGQEPGLGEERIRRMVFEKTGLAAGADVRTEKPKKKIWDSKIFYLASGLVAGMAIMAVGFFAIPSFNNNGNKPGLEIAQTGNADKETETPDDNTTPNVTTTNPDQAVGNDGADDVKELEGADDEKDKKGDGNGKKPHKPVVDPKVVYGEKGTLEELAPDEINDLLDEIDHEVEMDSFDECYNTVDDMVNDSDIIIRGEKVTQSFEEASSDNDYYINGKIKIKTVYFQNGERVASGDKIFVKEGIRVNELDKVCRHKCGYMPMKVGKEYILFLKDSGRGYYNIAGEIYGRVAISSDEKLIYPDGDYDTVSMKAVIKINNAARDQFITAEAMATKAPDPEPIEEPTVAPEETVEPEDIDSSNSN